jgi:hypothetical protein
MKTQADTDFLRSGGNKWGEVVLQPFTPQRQALASEMGMKWPHLDRKDFVQLVVTGEDGEDINVTHYRQSFKDSIVAVWLCLQPDCTPLESDPAQAMQDAWKWAEQEGISQNSMKFSEALVIWMKITNEISRAIGKPVIKGDNESDGELPGEP